MRGGIHPLDKYRMCSYSRAKIVTAPLIYLMLSVQMLTATSIHLMRSSVHISANVGIIWRSAVHVQTFYTIGRKHNLYYYIIYIREIQNSCAKKLTATLIHLMQSSPPSP